MHSTLVLASAAALASAAPPQLAPAMTPAVRSDVQCFLLNLLAAGSTEDAELLTAATGGTMYFYGKLRVEAPNLNLVEAVRHELTAMNGNPKTEAIGEACDAEVQQRGKDMIELGEELMKAEAQLPASTAS